MSELKAAVAFRDVSKSFRVWHEKNDSLKAKVTRRRTGRFTDFTALDHVSFEIPEGATFGIIGANGSGKSTSLKLIARILVPNDGDVDVNGKVSSLLELGAGFHPELTGRENVFLNGAILGVPRRTLQDRFDEIVDFAGVHEFIDNQVKTYSSGMAARLGFAVAVNVDPDILLVDEVLSVGDAAFQRRCAEKIAELRSGGRTVVVVSHDLGLVRQLCDIVVWIDHGRIQDMGNAEDVLEMYQRSVHPDAAVDEHGRVRFGSGDARVRLAELHTPWGGQPRARDKLTVRLTLDGIEVPHRHVLGIELRRTDGTFVSRATTRSQLSLNGPWPDGTVVTYDISELPLLAGSYVLHTWLLDDETQHLVDATDQQDFDVDPQAHADESGLVALGGTWNLAS